MLQATNSRPIPALFSWSYCPKIQRILTFCKTYKYSWPVEGGWQYLIRVYPRICKGSPRNTVLNERLLNCHPFFSRQWFCAKLYVQTLHLRFSEHLLLDSDELVVLQPWVLPHSPLEGAPAKKTLLFGAKLSFVRWRRATRRWKRKTNQNSQWHQADADDTKGHQDILFSLITCVIEYEPLCPWTSTNPICQYHNIRKAYLAHSQERGNCCLFILLVCVPLSSISAKNCVSHMWQPSLSMLALCWQHSVS